MALLGSDFDPTFPPDSEARNNGASRIRDVKTRLKAFASVLFNPETGNFMPGVIPPSALTPTNAAGTYTKVTVDPQGRITSGQTPNTLAGLGILDAFDNNTIIPIANGGTGLNSAPVSGRNILGALNTGGFGWFQLVDTPSIAWSFNDGVTTPTGPQSLSPGQIAATYKSPVVNPQPQTFVVGTTFAPTAFNGRIIVVNHNLSGLTGLQGVMTIIGVKVYVNGPTWTGVGSLNFTNSSNTNNANNQLVIPESALVNATRLSDTTSGKGIVTFGTSGAWAIPATDDFVMFTGSNLPPSAGGQLDIAILVQVT